MWLIGSFRSTSSGDAGLNDDGKKQLIWVVVETSIFYVHPENWGNDPIWQAYFSIGLNHQLDSYGW